MFDMILSRVNVVEYITLYFFYKNQVYKNNEAEKIKEI